MVSKSKKSITTTFIATVILCLAIITLFSYARIGVSESAQATDLSWTPSIRVQTGNGNDPTDDYTVINQPREVNADQAIGFFIRIPVSADIFNGSTFKYATSTTKVDNTDTLTWNTIPSNSPVSKTEDDQEVRYIWSETNVAVSFTGYVYFRREYSVNQGNGLTTTEKELYSAPLDLSYTVRANDYEPEITNISALMVGNTPYDGRWIASGLTFTITTGSMNGDDSNVSAFLESGELLSYSVDGGKNYVPVTRSNTVEIKDRSLVNCTIKFRLTNSSGDKSYEKEYEVPVNMDPYKPEFGINVQTKNADGQNIEYLNGSWTSKQVTFSIYNVSSCCSDIKYYVSINGGEYTDALAGDNTFTTTTNSVKFRAINGAGTVYEYSTVFNVNIDGSVPNAQLSASTTHPDDDTKKKDLSQTTENGTIKFGYANGNIEVYVYNRNAYGQPINNASGTVFQYQEKIDGIYSGSWRALSTKVTSDLGDEGYVLTASTKEVISVTRTFKFRIMSNAGLTSDEVEATFTIIKSAYLIELGDVTAEINELGWIADKAVIRVSVPTDSRRGTDGTYSIPTTSYTFYYKATNSVGEDSYAVGRAAEFHEEKENEVRWWYEFDLVASADSTFTIYAKNAAGKKSANTETTDDKIKIDVLQPVYGINAYIHPTSDIPQEDYVYIDVENPGWVNGQIVLVLKVREGVSGIYVKEMVYAVENGEILRDEYTGEIVWQPRSQKLDVSETVREKDAYGTEWLWHVYRITIDVNDELTEISKTYVGTREYKWRVYTNSGKYVDAEFTANIDTSDVIAITDFTATSGDKSENVVISGASGQRYVDLENYGFSVCENSGLTFASSIDKVGIDDHYKIRYQLFDGDDKTVEEILDYASRLTEAYFIYLNAGATLSLSIPENAIGDIYVAIYIESTAQAYDGSVISAGPYVIKLHYDTKNLVVTYGLEVDDNGTDRTEEMQSGAWVKGRLLVTMNIKTNEVGGLKVDNSYTFYYMRLTTLAGGVPENGWIQVDDGLLNELTDSYTYEFTLPFLNEGYSGYVAVSVCNGAGYRSKQDASSVVQIRIDNTTPEVDEAIYYTQVTSSNGVEGVRADASEITVGGNVVEVHTYYSTAEIELQPIVDAKRSSISFYYYYLGSEISEISYNKSDFSAVGSSSAKLFANANIDLNGSSYRTVYYAIYAVNAVGTEGVSAGEKAGGIIEIKRVYQFIYDPSVIEGSMSYDTQNGTQNEQTGMFTYLWKDNIKLYVNGTGSYAPQGASDYITYQFSVDKGVTWYDYLETGVALWYKSGQDVTLSFSPDLFREYVDENGNQPFANGVNCVFMFRARNKAGAVKLYNNVYIAMEDTVPVFEVITLDKDNVSYYGGDIDLNKEPNKWSSGPVTIQINTLVSPASGIKYMYYLEYYDGSSIVSTASEGSFGKQLYNYSVFSTDTLDGFDLNRDAVITITAIGNSDSNRYSQISVRIAVDQVVPVFNLSGNAYKQGSSGTELITSGQWTNKDTVSVSRDRVNINVSEVEYWYTITSKDSSSSATAPTKWSDEVGSIDRSESCVLTVTATSKSGLSYQKEFVINIDTVAPIIHFDGGMNVTPGQEYYIDLRVYVEEANIEICEYITIKEETRGFAFSPKGYILSTSSVDNSTRYEQSTGEPYRGYVKIYVKDFAGNEATISFYVLPFRLTVNNLTLTDTDLAQVDAYEVALSKARIYMEPARVSYFENLISRLNDRENTLRKEIQGYQDYLEKLYNRTSFELRSDYEEMYDFMQTYLDYETYGKAWMQTAITGDSTSKYSMYFDNFQTQFGKLQALMDQVEKTENNVIALPAINMVARDDYEDILRVYDEYKNLTMDQKACFTDNLYNKLLDLKEACEVLLLVDEDLGVALDGDFAPGATINVTEFGSTTDTYKNAQEMLANTVSESEPRTIVSIHRVALDGAYSQTSASDIVVTLPIAEDYRDYIYFSVYELSDDGTLKPVSGTEIQPDGKSVVFKTEDLATYVLCVKAQMEKTDTTEGTYGTILGLELDTKMITYLIYVGIALFAIIILVVIILGIRHRRFLNSYNKAYRNSMYRKGVKGIPKGNKMR